MPPPILHPRDFGEDAANVGNTFSSWDSCMSEAYCKWPAIIGIIIGSLVVVSIIFCCARCLCCGLECCCGICSCFNRCCPSPRNKKDGYQQAGPPPQPYQQYQSHTQPMMYGAGGFGYRGPQTATFDAPGKKGAAGGYNEDALPAMPSWDAAPSKRVQDEDVEMEKLDQNAAQQESLLNNQRNSGGRYYNNDQSTAGDLGTMQTGPYHDYDAHRQFAGSPVSTAPSSMYPPTYRTAPQSVYGEPNYAPSVAPSYHTYAPAVTSPVQQQPTLLTARRPVQGTWRDV
jgi:hypothetical protein